MADELTGWAQALAGMSHEDQLRWGMVAGVVYVLLAMFGMMEKSYG